MDGLVESLVIPLPAFFKSPLPLASMREYCVGAYYWLGFKNGFGQSGSTDR